MKSILVRDMDLGEFEIVTKIYGESFSELYPEFAIASLLRCPGAWCQLAVDEETGVPIGFLIARIILDEAEILSIGIVSAARRQGAAQGLLTAACERAISLGALALHLEVGEDNQGAVALYRKMGFRSAGIRPNYYRRANSRRVAAILMTRNLKSSYKTK
jgi:ribosomal-protein-alanine N-acetyltransferase